MYTYPRNVELSIKATTNIGINASIVLYEWILNGTLLSHDTDNFKLNTNNLKYGDNILSLRVKNSCDNYSEYVTKIIKVGESIPNEIPTQKIVPILIDTPEVSKTIVIDMFAKVTITIIDSFNRPIKDITISINSISGITDFNGQVILNNVPYGDRQIIMKGL